MLISRKEIISVLLLVTALICVLNASAFVYILPFHSSYEQVAQQVVNVGTAYICVIYALSTWLYHSNYYRARLEMRLVLVAIILVLIVCHIVATFYFHQFMMFEKLDDATDLVHLRTSYAVVSKICSLTLSVICMLLLFTVLVMIIVKICQAKRKRAHSRQNL